MKKLLFLPFFIAMQASAQTLLTIGNDSVSVQEFLSAYKKTVNSPQPAKAVEDYLQLYIASKLKIKEAITRGYDTLPQLKADLEALRAQVLPGYLNDPQSVKALTDEAFLRSQKDLHIAHIFIAVQNAADTVAAYQKATEAYKNVNSGVAFEAVARQYSDDPEAKANGGDIGFVTVFSLPYELEDIVYKIPLGQVSAPYRSGAGYHIFKIIAERKALGRMQAAQILLAFSPDAGAAEKVKLRKRADSIYQALKRGASFESAAEKWSNDALSAEAGGLLQPFGVGQYHTAFEKSVFALPYDGAISAPFETVHGMHIVKRTKLLPVNKDAANTTAMQALREMVLQSDRMRIAKEQLAKIILADAGYKPLTPNMLAAVKGHTRQALHGATEVQNALNGETALFTLDKTVVTLNQWMNHARNFGSKEDGSEKDFTLLWNEFVEGQAMEHYSKNLEQYNADFKSQMKELREGSLFFEIMQREIWGPAQADSVALRRYYNEHQEKYRWSRSADAVVFYAPGKATAQKLAAQVALQPARWQQAAAQYDESVTTDSARLEWSAIPGADKLPFKAGMASRPVINEGDGTASFAYIFKVYNQPLQRSFEESRGAVINDYQGQKEQKWVEELRKKYVVKIAAEELEKLETAAQ